MNFAQSVKIAKKTIESAMIDKMKVVRYEDIIDPVTRREDHREITVYDDEPCFISYSTQNNDNPNAITDANIPIQWKPLVLCRLETKIKAGDEITITCPYRDGATYYGKASDINAELTHNEFNIGIKSEA